MINNKKKVFIPPEKRKPNKVDELQTQIKRIQESCDHDFRLVKEPKLSPSLVAGVFVGSVEGPAEVSRSDIELQLVCMKCSKKKETNILVTCPKCLSPMKKGECLGAGSRKRFFGKEYLYYSILPSRCPNCNFRIASDVWDQ